ncbi:MAG TPA: efflux RND transporter periplasmic adaptor subunit, partial [Candidatus Xenobia bacterium]
LPVPLLLVFLLSALAMRSRSPQAASPPAPVRVETVQAQLHTGRPVQHISGQAEAWRSATVSSEVAGRVLERLIQQGDRVRKGDIVLRIDPATAQAEVDQAAAASARAWAGWRQAQTEYHRTAVESEAARQQAQAQLVQAQAADDRVRHGSRPQELETARAARVQAEADAALARRDASRYQTLLDQGAVSNQMWDQADTRRRTADARVKQAQEALSLAQAGARTEDRESAGAQVRNARAGLTLASTGPLRLASLEQEMAGLRAQAEQADAACRQARLALSHHQVEAPFDGRILAVPIETGELVSPGTPLLRVGETRRIKATFSVPESVLGWLHVGQLVTMGPWRGRIRTLGLQADLRTRTFPIEVLIDNPAEHVLPGMVLRLDLSEPPRQVLTLPVGAVGTDGNRPYVYVVGRGRAERRTVRLGSLSGCEVEIVDGLAAGETVATNPQRLSDGLPVDAP